MARIPMATKQESDVTSSDEENLDFDDDNLRAIAEVYKNAGNEEYQKKEFRNAIYYYTKGIKVNCKDDELKAQLYNNRATAYFYQENYQDSLEDARAATELSPTYIKAIARGASACVKLGLYEAAITWCDKGLALDKNNKTLLDLRSKSLSGLTKSQDGGNDMTAREMESEMSKSQAKEGSGAANQSSNKNTRILEFSLKTAQEQRDKAKQKYFLFELGAAYSQAEDFKTAIVYHELYLQLAKEMCDRPGEITAYGLLGNHHHRLAEYIKAIYYHELQLQLAKETCDRTVEGVAYGYLGNDHERLRDLESALYYYELQLKRSKEMGSRMTEEIAYANLGRCFQINGDFKKATKYHELSLRIAREGHDRRGEGNVCSYLGTAYQNLGDLTKAIHYHELHQKIAQELGDKLSEGKALGNLGTDYYLLGDFITAISYHELHLQISREIGDKIEEGIAYGRLGRDFQCFGDLEKAVHYHELSLGISREVSDRRREGRAYGDLGDDHHCLGDFKKAIYYHELYLQIGKQMSDKTAEGNAYGSLGTDYRLLGDFKKAIHYHELHLQIARLLSLKASEGSAYGNLGSDYHCLGEYETAVKYHELHLKSTKDTGDSYEEGKAYGNLGTDHEKLGNLKTAIYYYECQLEKARKQGSRIEEGSACNHLGTAYAVSGDKRKAICYHEQQLKISKEVRDIDGEGTACFNLGLCFHDLGDFRNAEKNMKRSLAIAKSTHNRVAEAESLSCLGLNFSSLGSLSEAVDHSKSSIRVLNEVRGCLQFQDKWKISLRHRYQTTYANLWLTLLKQGKVEEALISAEQGRAQALKDLMEISYGFETFKDDLSSVEETHNDTLRCLPSNTIFEAVAGQSAHFWVIENGENLLVRSKEITNDQAADFATFAGSLTKKAFDELGVRAGVKCEDRSLDKLYDVERSGKSDQSQSRPFQFGCSSLTTLYDVIIGPISDLVHGDELVIVPDGNLWLAPYAALLDSNSKYLSESFRIRMIPSLTIWKLITDCPADHHLKRGALIVGDPWVQEVTTPLGEKLDQLDYARDEVEMIGQILNIAPLIGTDATKEEVLKRLPSVALVHIAAHGSMETGEIALTPNPSSSSKPPKEEDYLLTIADVLNIKLRARLVVLSCCHSACGEIKAEGVVGIARAFLGAGARSVLVSLWAIDDEATLEFMKMFYKHLSEGRRASEALSEAMKSMRESDRFNKVKFWAPFVLVGDDVTVNFGGTV